MAASQGWLSITQDDSTIYNIGSPTASDEKQIISLSSLGQGLLSAYRGKGKDGYISIEDSDELRKRGVFAVHFMTKDALVQGSFTQNSIAQLHFAIDFNVWEHMISVGLRIGQVKLKP